MAFGLFNYLVSNYTLLFLLITITSTSVLSILFGSSLFLAFIQSYIFWNIGLRGVLAFLANWIRVFADPIAESYGWEKGQSFQREIAAADGAFGVIGLLSPLFSFDFSLATILAFCICTILSELSGMKELRSRESGDVSSSIKFGMKTDLFLAIVVLTSTLVYLCTN